MLIGVLSDTHMPKRSVKLPARLIAAFQDVDIILHLGDWVSMDVYHQLRTLAPVEGVAGNNDGPEIVHRFGKRKILSLEGRKFGLVHGHEPLSRLTTPEKAVKSFQGEQVDCILFGHSHQPYHHIENGVLVFNPGSPTDKRREKEYSFGLLHIQGSTLSARHVFYDKI